MPARAIYPQFFRFEMKPLNVKFEKFVLSVKMHVNPKKLTKLLARIPMIHIVNKTDSFLNEIVTCDQNEFLMIIGNNLENRWIKISPQTLPRGKTHPKEDFDCCIAVGSCCSLLKSRKIYKTITVENYY